MWHGLVVCPQLYMCTPWGQALLPSGSWFPYQTQRVRLDRVYMSFSFFKVLSQCKFTNIYTHTFYLLYKQTTGQKQAFGLSEFPTPPSSFRTTHCLPIKSSQIPFLDFQILLPPNCRFNLITNSPAPQPAVLFTVPKCSHHSPTSFYSCCF